jgi:hypothetical protein
VMGMGDKACWSWLTDGAPPQTDIGERIFSSKIK